MPKIIWIIVITAVLGAIGELLFHISMVAMGYYYFVGVLIGFMVFGGSDGDTS